jgi:hypothetical protein
VQLSAIGGVISKFTICSCSLQDFVNSAGKFNSIVVKMLKTDLCSSHNGVPLNFFEKTLTDIQLISSIV